MKNFNARFAKVRSDIRKGRVDRAIERLTFLQGDIAICFDNLHKTMETRGNTVLPREDWKMEIVDAVGSSHRLTINPTVGRVTLKISPKASEQVRKDLVQFVNQFIKLELGDIAPVSVRGKIKFDTDRKYYSATLLSESKKFKYNYRMEV